VISDGNFHDFGQIENQGCTPFKNPSELLPLEVLVSCCAALLPSCRVRIAGFAPSSVRILLCGSA